MSGIADTLGQGIAGLGGIVSNIVGQDVRLGPGGSSLGADIAGQSQPYYSTNQNLAYAQGTPQSNPYAPYTPGYTTGVSPTALNQALQSSQPIGSVPTQSSGNSNSNNNYNPAASNNYNPAASHPGTSGSWRQNSSYGYFNANGDWVSMAPPPTQADVDAAYQPAINDVNQMLSDWQGNQQNYIGQFTAPYQALIPQAQQAYQAGVNQINTQTNQVNTQAQNAIDAAKNLYNQTLQGANQRFGGTSSAGDFARAFYNRSFNQQLGGINSTQQQNLTALGNQGSTILSQYNNNLQQIQAQQAAAQNQALSDFQNKLQQINSLKATLDSDKAAMKINELQNYRSLVANINDAAAQRATALQQSVLGTAGQLANSNSYLAAFGRTPVPVADQLQAVFQAIGGNPAQGGGGQQITGYYNPNRYQNQPTGYYNPYQNYPQQ